MATEVELVFKGWLKKSNVSDPTKRRSSFLSRSSSNWKKKFVLLLKRTENATDIPYLEFYEKEYTAEDEHPKGSLRLWPTYRVEKKHDPSGKTFVFEVKTAEETYRLQAENETIMDLWVFYCQIQTKLRPDFPGHFFEVMPDDSDAMRRIGAKGSKCLLHLSPWGVTLALKRTKALLAQWPLTCVREFESSEEGDFSMEAGRSSPMGEAQYIFKTAIGQDGQIYDLLDEYTTELIKRQLKENPSSQPQPASEEEVAQEYEHFRLATFGLLPGTKSRSSSLSTAPSASRAVPVPPTRGPPREPLQELPSTPGSRMRHNVSQPALGTERPPLPPRNNSPMKRSLSTVSAPATPRNYSSPYDHEDMSILGGADRGAVGGGKRWSATESEKMAFSKSSSGGNNQMSWVQPYQRRLSSPAGSLPNRDINAPFFMPSVYENTARLSYGSSFEKSMGISLSPQDMILGGFSNPGFLASPQQSLSRSPWYNEIRAGYAHGYMPGTDIRHTYLDPQRVHDPTAEAYYASPPSKQQQQLRILIPQPVSGSLKRSLSFDNIFSRLSISGSSIGSAQLQPLDLANSLTYASPRLSVGLPKTPSHAGLPPEVNTYIGTPGKPTTMVAFPFPIPNSKTTEQDKIQYEKMSVQQRQSFNNNNVGHYIYHNPAPIQSAPLALVSGAIPVRAVSQPQMKRSRSEADLIDCKEPQGSGYMVMRDRANLFAGYMDMEKGCLTKLKRAADESATKKAQAKSGMGDKNVGVSMQADGSSHYMIPRNVPGLQVTMTDQEIQQSIQVYGTTGRQKKSRFMLSKLFSQKPEISPGNLSDGLESPNQRQRKFRKSPSQTLLDKLKRSPKIGSKRDGNHRRKMERSRSETDLHRIDHIDTGYMDMLKGSVGVKGQMKRTNSDFNHLDNNVFNSSGNPIPMETADGMVYHNRKRFQSTPGVPGDSHATVPIPYNHNEAGSSYAVTPASHSIPTNSPIKKKTFLKMFRKSSKSRMEDSEIVPDISSTESSPAMSQASRRTQASPPQPAPKPTGIGASNQTKSFTKPKTQNLQSDSNLSAKFYLSTDHETVTELTQRPLPSLPRKVFPPTESAFHGTNLQSPQMIMPTSQVASYRDYQDVKPAEVGQQIQPVSLPQNAAYIDEYMATDQHSTSWSSTHSSGDAFDFSVSPARPVPIPPQCVRAGHSDLRQQQREEDVDQRSSAKLASLV